MLGHPICTLSVELIDEIVDWVALLGTGVLALLQSARAFGPRCRMHFYEQVVFRLGRSSRLPTFRKLLETNPDILPCIRGIVIAFMTPEDLWSEPNADFEYITHLLGKSPQPPALLQIRGPTNLSVHNEPHSFHQWLSASFFPSTLRELCLQNVHGLVPQALRQFRNLESLKLSSVGIIKSTPSSFPDGDSGRLPQLNVLDSTNSYKLLRKVAAPSRMSDRIVSLKALKVLKLCPEDMKQIPLVQAILDQAYSNLQELHFTNSTRCTRTFPFSEML